MKLLATKNTYKQASNFLTINGNQLEAWSYGWWKYVATDSVGNVFFNYKTYSSFTSKHQGNVSSILGQLGIQVNYTFSKAERSNHFGHGIRSMFDAEIEALELENKELLAATKKKGSWKKTNIQRLETIKHNEFTIKDLINYRDNYLDKKLIPIKKRKLSEFKKADSWKPYFKKPNGKIDTNGLCDLLNIVGGYCDAPKSIDRIKTLLDMTSANDITPILIYRFSNDLNNMIPDVDSVEYQALLKAVKRYGINKQGLTTLCLDKLHTFLINQQNKKNYTPRPTVEFPLTPEVEALSTVDELKVIKTDKELRAEGRKQSHCIGGKHYIDQCLQGCQALNYKGYTFFLSPENDLIETHGKHNSPTPLTVELELKQLLREQQQAA